MQSIRRLIREGYVEEEVELLPESALRDKTIIVEILRDTHKVLRYPFRPYRELSLMRTFSYIIVLGIGLDYQHCP